MTKRKRSAPKGLQFKSFGFDTKAVAEEPDDDGLVTFKAYAAVFDNVDSHNDVIKKGAFANSLKAWGEKGAPIPVFYNHGAFSSDPHDNMGFLAVAQEDAKGLAVEVALDVKHNAKAAYAHRLIKSDRLRELSIGYITKRWEYEKEDGESDWDAKRNLNEVDLLEVSVVSVASNPLATVTEKAAAFLYGEQGDDSEGDEDPDAKDADEAKEVSDDVVAEALAALDAATEALELAKAALAPTDDEDESDEDEDPADEQDDSGEPAGTKSLSARTRVALAMTALHGAETE